MDRWTGKVALVTGATVGLGRAIVQELLNNGMHVIGCARNLEGLKALKKSFSDRLDIIQCDVSDEKQVIEMFSSINSINKGLDVCINNAGLGKAAPILSGQTQDWKTMIDVNILGVLNVTREAVKIMREKKTPEGHIINVSSVVGHTVVDTAGGNFSVYAATKFAVTAITTATRQELLHEEELNIRVSQVSPGVTKTEFIGRQFNNEMAETVFKQVKSMNAEDIAQTVKFILSLSPTAQVQDIIVQPSNSPPFPIL